MWVTKNELFSQWKDKSPNQNLISFNPVNKYLPNMNIQDTKATSMGVALISLFSTLNKYLITETRCCWDIVNAQIIYFKINLSRGVAIVKTCKMDGLWTRNISTKFGERCLYGDKLDFSLLNSNPVNSLWALLRIRLYIVFRSLVFWVWKSIKESLSKITSQCFISWLLLFKTDIINNMITQ